MVLSSAVGVGNDAGSGEGNGLEGSAYGVMQVWMWVAPAGAVKATGLKEVCVGKSGAVAATGLEEARASQDL